MNQQKEINVAIVGCGMISEFHAEAIKKISGARVVAFCDNSKTAVESRAAQFGGDVYTSVDELVKNPNIDIISICTPSGSHLEIALAAANAKKHVIVEKPLEITPERVDMIIDACKRNNVKLGTIFQRRFMDTSLILKNAIDSGRFGKIVLADVYIKWYRTQEYYSSSNWRGTYKYDGGGALMNQGIHGIDLLQWLMGGIEKVTAFTDTLAHTGIEVEDVAVASVRFRSGALGVIEGTTGSWPGEKLRIEISGTEGTVIMEDEEFKVWKFKNETEEDEEIRKKYSSKEGSVSGGASDPRAINSEGHRKIYEDFINAIRENREPLINGFEGRDAVAIITAIYKSAKEQKPIDVK
ncbi:MAG: Gfo/Idh/MocA family oxidoreductase [Candidatus Anstonellales archaeon]